MPLHEGCHWIYPEACQPQSIPAAALAGLLNKIFVSWGMQSARSEPVIVLESDDEEQVSHVKKCYPCWVRSCSQLSPEYTEPKLLATARF